jgi:hypothetical protein
MRRRHGSGAAWVGRQLARGVRRPVVYASVSSMDTVLAALESNGIERTGVRVWTARYTSSPHLCGPYSCGYGRSTGSDATQWTDRAVNLDLDESLCNDSFFGPPPPPPDRHHYDRYSVGPFPFRDAGGKLLKLNERVIVQE